MYDQIRQEVGARQTGAVPRVTALSEPNGAEPIEAAANGVSAIQVKPGRHREATLYHALGGGGAGNGRTLAQLREAAVKAHETSELPVWRRSGFWTTSLAGLDLDALDTGSGDDSDEVPDVVSAHPDRPATRRAPSAK